MGEEEARLSGPLTALQLEEFEDQGYVVVDDVFDVFRHIDPVLAEYDCVLWVEAHARLGSHRVETSDLFRWAERGPGCG
jgi:hypothetical protein